MKKFILIFSVIFTFSANAQAEENIVSDDLSIKVEQETKK